MIEIIPMKFTHIEQVTQIEYDSNIIPWTKENLLDDFFKNESCYFVAIKNNNVCGYCSMHLKTDAGHVTNIVVKDDSRGIGIGSLLLEKLISFSMEKAIAYLELEVKISNIIAQRLYTKYGFKPIGFKKKFYIDTNEDAIVMQKYL